MRFVLLVFLVSSFVFGQDQYDKFVSVSSGENSKSQTPKLEIEIIHDELLPISKNDFLTLSQEIFQYECERMNFTKDIHLTVEIKDLVNDVRGYVVPNSTSDSMFLSKDSIKAKDHLTGIFAHELGHIIYFKSIDTLFCSGNMYWAEGFASWAAGKYYLQWQGYQNYKSAIKEIVSSNKFHDIKNIYGEPNKPAKQRDVVYIEWASFVDYLIDKYGFEKSITLSSLFAQVGKETLPSNGEPLTLSDNDDLLKAINHYDEELEQAYRKVYSKSFDELKKQWKLRNKIIN